jgi:hypothetical protein
MSKEDWAKAALVLVAAVAALFLAWHVGVIVFQVIGTAMAMLSTLITWLLVVLGAAFSSLVTLGIVIAMGRLVLHAIAGAIDQVKQLFAAAGRDAAAAAIDATALAVLAGGIGLVAYLSTGDFLKGHELSLAKAVAVSTIVIVLCKIALYTDSRAVRTAVWPILVVFYAAPFAYGAYHVHSECPAQPVFECVMEFDDAVEPAAGIEPAKEAPPAGSAQHADAAAAPKPIEGVRASAPIAASAASKSASASTAPRLDSAASSTARTPDAEPNRQRRQHSMLVAGHALLFVLALLAMLFPFGTRGWKRLLGIGAE